MGARAAQSVWKLDYGWDDRGSIPDRGVQTGSEAHPASYTTNTRGSYTGDEVIGARLHLVPRLRKRGAIPPLTQYVTMAWSLFKHRGNFAFYLTVLKYRGKLREPSEKTAPS
jgi:hypothetical protein